MIKRRFLFEADEDEDTEADSKLSQSRKLMRFTTNIDGYKIDLQLKIGESGSRYLYIQGRGKFQTICEAIRRGMSRWENQISDSHPPVVVTAQFGGTRSKPGSFSVYILLNAVKDTRLSYFRKRQSIRGQYLAKKIDTVLKKRTSDTRKVQVFRNSVMFPNLETALQWCAASLQSGLIREADLLSLTTKSCVVSVTWSRKQREEDLEESIRRRRLRDRFL